MDNRKIPDIIRDIFGSYTNFKKEVKTNLISGEIDPKSTEFTLRVVGEYHRNNIGDYLKEIKKWVGIALSDIKKENRESAPEVVKNWQIKSAKRLELRDKRRSGNDLQDEEDESEESVNERLLIEDHGMIGEFGQRK